jgi:hypothetical protein
LESGVSGYQTMNIGSGTPTSFNDIAKTCASIVGYEPQIQNLTDKPMGVATRYADIREMVQFYTPQTTLYEGLERVINFIRSSEGDGSAQDVPNARSTGVTGKATRLARSLCARETGLQRAPSSAG